ncbi:MAG: 4-hydroxythreonine-4-phosphate dehydrogenase PdxA [Bacteroidales bacterium]|nr:4-hydroxythreonine-4-phosphate dehydrogenase PdxA [Candidatus Physcousia equi]
MSTPIRIALTPGDINGVGYEVILKAFLDPVILDFCTPIIYGNPKTLAYHRKALEIEVPYVVINDAADAQNGKLNLLAVSDEEVPVNLGEATPEAGRAAFDSLEAAVADWKEGQYDVLVTAPINKHSIQGGDFHFPGHTEYLQERLGDGSESLMILLNERIRVALVTTHLPIAKIADSITTELIQKRIHQLEKSLKRDFLVTRPRIAVLSLNPHAGDNGLLGNEEKDIIEPAIEQANEEGINAYGPFSADGFFGTAAYEHYDAVLAMYHDQGLAPFKTIAMDDGVNFTAGLPIVRTSPDHGTAYDIAGRNEADANSLRQAIYLAIDVFRNRAFYDEENENPLPKLFHERREDERRDRRQPQSYQPRQFQSGERMNNNRPPFPNNNDNAANEEGAQDNE